MLETEQSSPSRALSPIRDESSGEELTVLPRHTKVIVIGNNRTKSVLVGLQGVVKKAVGLGGWHWLVLKNGVEVKLQRNALSVLEPPTGDEIDDDDENMPDNYSCDSDLGEKRTNIHELSATTIDFHKLSKPRVRHKTMGSLIIKVTTTWYLHGSSIQHPAEGELGNAWNELAMEILPKIQT